MLPSLKRGASAPLTNAEICDLQGKAHGHHPGFPERLPLADRHRGSLGRLYGQYPGLTSRCCERLSLVFAQSDTFSLRFLRGGLAATTGKPNFSNSKPEAWFSQPAFVR